MSLTLSKAIIVIALVSGLLGCAQYDNKRGVEVVWQADSVNSLVKGESTRKDVLNLLGPPSQVISLDEETVFYYLFEYSQGDGLILIVYNRVRVDTQYDRAIFFFDENDVLTEFSTRVHDSDED